jgi:hypothetical protein
MSDTDPPLALWLKKNQSLIWDLQDYGLLASDDVHILSRYGHLEHHCGCLSSLAFWLHLHGTCRKQAHSIQTASLALRLLLLLLLLLAAVEGGGAVVVFMSLNAKGITCSLLTKLQPLTTGHVLRSGCCQQRMHISWVRQFQSVDFRIFCLRLFLLAAVYSSTVFTLPSGKHESEISET